MKFVVQCYSFQNRQPSFFLRKKFALEYFLLLGLETVRNPFWGLTMNTLSDGRMKRSHGLVSRIATISHARNILLQYYYKGSVHLPRSFLSRRYPRCSCKKKPQEMLYFVLTYTLTRVKNIPLRSHHQVGECRYSCGGSYFVDDSSKIIRMYVVHHF